MPEFHATVFAESLDRCLEAGDFLESFYDRFLASSEEVRSHFQNTSFDRQRAMLRGAFFMMRDAAREGGTHDPYLRYVAERHSRRDQNIRPELYDLWLDCLIETVADFDPKYDHDVEEAWRNIMADGIRVMKKAY
jgi:hemoglobin-like flavoprotein